MSASEQLLSRVRVDARTLPLAMSLDKQEWFQYLMLMNHRLFPWQAWPRVEKRRDWRTYSLRNVINTAL
jgi:hypothetical protein